jgi:MFS family permease
MSADPSAPMPPVQGKVSLCVLFFLHAAAMAAYAVPFPNVLRAHGLEQWVAYAVGTGCIAAFISPMIAGALADRRVAPERLLAALTAASGVLLILTHYAVAAGWGPRAFLSLMMAYALCNAPGFSLVTSIVLSRLSDARREFGPIRVWATWGWMLASFAVGLLALERSPGGGYLGGAIFLIEAAYCLTLRPTHPPPDKAPRRLRDLFGWEALPLLKHRDHRLIFLTSAIFTALMSTLYLYTVQHLADRGDTKPSSTMALAQLCEGLATLGLAAALTRFRLKWLLAAGLLLGFGRYALLAMDVRPAMVASVALHGPLFVCFYLTCQIYLEQRIDPRIRSQGQALLSLMNNGIGNLTGYLAVSWWHARCGGHTSSMNWPLFWNVLALAVAALTVIFIISYKGRKREAPTTPAPGTGGQGSAA